MMCGWLTGMMVYRGTRTGRNILITAGGNVIIGIDIFLKYGWQAMIVFAVIVPVILIIYFVFMKVLNNHLKPD